MLRSLKGGLISALAVALFIAAMSWAGGNGATAASGNDLYLSAAFCDTDPASVDGSACNVAQGSTVTVQVIVKKLTLANLDADAIAGYRGWQARVDYSSGLTRVDQAGTAEELCLPGWSEGEAGGSGSYVGGCVQDTSTIEGGKGPIMQVDFTCSSPGLQTLTLTHGAPLATNLIDESDAGVANDPSGSSETLNVRCVAQPTDCAHIIWTWDGDDCVVGTDLWHIESAADLGSGNMLAFNQGCTGAPAVGCNYNTGAAISGTATSPTFDPTDSATLVFKTARGTESACGSFDRTLVSYSTNGGGSYSPLDLTGGTISSGGQYLSTGGEICGGSLTLQTVNVPLPDGTTNVRFTFDSVDNLNNLFVGQFIDDVSVTQPDAYWTVDVDNAKSGGPLEGTCWGLFYYDAAVGGQVLLDIIGDNGGVAACETFGGPFVDEDPAIGGLGFHIFPGQRLTYGSSFNWRVSQASTPTGYIRDETQYGCYLTSACPIVASNAPDPNGDVDGDGCATSKEQQTAIGSEMTGGRRDYRSYWDFFDIDGNKTIDLFYDIFGVAYRYGANDAGGTAPINRFSDPDSIPPAAPAYHPRFDRSPPAMGADPWDMGPPNGTIDLFTDIFGVAFQYGHHC